MNQRNLVLAALLTSSLGISCGTNSASKISAPDPALIETLLTLGGKVYSKHCSSCHQPDGEGVGVFPAITGSPIANGEPAKHIDVVYNGIDGTAMKGFSEKLDSREIAAVISFQRNALGNSTGDYVFPQTIEAMRF